MVDLTRFGGLGQLDYRLMDELERRSRASGALDDIRARRAAAQAEAATGARMNPYGGYLGTRAGLERGAGMGRGAIGEFQRAQERVSGMPLLDRIAMGTAGVPVVGDVAGAAADVTAMVTDPAERTLQNVGLASLSALPFIPYLGRVRDTDYDLPEEGPASRRDVTTGAEAGRPEPVAGPSFSTRVPTIKAMEGAAQEAERAGDPLRIDWDEWTRSPKAAEAAARVKASPFTRIRARSTRGILDEAAEEQARNLLFLHGQVDPTVLPRSENWYLGANRAAADRAAMYGLPIENTAGVYAALSPQKDWFQNLELGDRLMDIWSRREGLQWTPEMAALAASGRVGMNSPAAQRAFENIQGQPLAALTDSPEIGLWSRIYDQTYNTPHYRVVDPEGYKGDWALNQSGVPSAIQWGSLGEVSRAVDALRATDPAQVSRALGGQHKVRSFGTNISNPMDPTSVTADTHAVAAGALRPLGGAAPEVLQNFGGGPKMTDPSFEPWMASVGKEGATGYQGTYPLTQRGVELAAGEVGMVPRGMQSVTWEAGRNLFENQKSAPMQRVANDIWRAYGQGRITQREAQEAIMNTFGPAVPPPAWAR